VADAFSEKTPQVFRRLSALGNMSPAKKLLVALPSKESYVLDAILAQAPMRLVIADGLSRVGNHDLELSAMEAPITVPPMSGERLASHLRQEIAPRPARIPRAA